MEIRVEQNIPIKQRTETLFFCCSCCLPERGDGEKLSWAPDTRAVEEDKEFSVKEEKRDR